jgi:hypothetical protein
LVDQELRRPAAKNVEKIAMDSLDVVSRFTILIVKAKRRIAVISHDLREVSAQP